jgi:hypothetical protein
MGEVIMDAREIAGACFVLFGSVCGAFGTHFFLQDRRFKQKLRRVRGRVVEITELMDDGFKRYRPLVEFVPAEGGPPLRATTHATYGDTYWKLGADVGIRYDPAEPSTTLIDGDGTGNQFGAEFFGLFAIVLVPVGLAMLFHLLPGKD